MPEDAVANGPECSAQELPIASVDISSEPAVSAGTEPAVSAGTEPAASAGTEPAASAGTEPAASAGTEPAASAGTEPAASAGTDPEPKLRECRFFVVGDIGAPGSPRVAVARAIAAQLQELQASFVVATGDNFYSCKNNKQFRESFETLRSEMMDMVNLPWYFVMGTSRLILISMDLSPKLGPPIMLQATTT